MKQKVPTVRLGLMGCGTVADYGHVPAIRELPGCELVSVYDPVQAQVDALCAKFGIRHGFTDLEAFLASGIDAVTITSPVGTHAANVLAAAGHGKDILCEKPLAATPRQGLRMIAAARRYGVRLYTGFDYRFSAVSLQIRDLVNRGAIGKLKHLRFVYNWDLHGKYLPGSTTQLNERRSDRMREGGPMMDCGVHQIDLARFWTGSEVASWHSSGVWVDDYAAPDHVFLHLQHANGVTSSVEMSFSYGHTTTAPRSVFTYDAIGTEGVIHYDRDARVFELRDARGRHELLFAGEKNFLGMYQAFLQVLQAGDDESPVLATGHDGCRASFIAQKATQAAIRQHKKSSRKHA